MKSTSILDDQLIDNLYELFHKREKLSASDTMSLQLKEIQTEIDKHVESLHEYVVDFEIDKTHSKYLSDLQILFGDGANQSINVDNFVAQVECYILQPGQQNPKSNQK